MKDWDRPTSHTLPEQDAAHVHDGGPWRGPSVEEWVERIAHGSTPQREYDEQGRFQPWIRRDVA